LGDPAFDAIDLVFWRAPDADTIAARAEQLAPAIEAFRPTSRATTALSSFFGERRPLSSDVGTQQFYAARGQRTRASSIRSHERRPLRPASGGRGESVCSNRREQGEHGLTLSQIDVGHSLEESCVPPAGNSLVLSLLSIREEKRQLERFSKADELELRGCRQRLRHLLAIEISRYQSAFLFPTSGEALFLVSARMTQRGSPELKPVGAPHDETASSG
jgi:hypothetical protein